jgi:ribosome-binding protein aMBF1 (putative translation factor)
MESGMEARCEICGKLLEEKELEVELLGEDLLVCEECEEKLKLKLLGV